MKLTPSVDKVDGCGVEGGKLLQYNLESVDGQSWKIWYGMVRLFKVRLGGSNSWPFGRESFALPLDQCKGLSVFSIFFWGGGWCVKASPKILLYKNSYSNPYESLGARMCGHYSRRILGFTKQIHISTNFKYNSCYLNKKYLLTFRLLLRHIKIFGF